jgi:dTMP kinase
VPPRGRLIALEGIDGCGKSTQAKAVAAALGARLTHEPGATPLGAQLRRLLLDPGTASTAPTPRAETLLMAADRAEHVAQVIEPALASGGWVVTDRYSGSTIAYQGYGRGLGAEGLAEVVAWATAGVEADLSVFVDVPVEVAVARRRGADRMERLGPEFATRVREGFAAQAAAAPARWLVVDGTREVDAITAHIVEAVRALLGPEPEHGR